MHDPKTLEAGLEDYADVINQLDGGWNSAMDLRFLRVTAREVVAEWVVGPQHRQPYGIVHGGVHCGVIEAVCSTGAAISALASGYSVVGLENHTSFIRAVREGTLTARAHAIHPGRRSQVWEASILDAEQRTVATGRVRLICLEPDATLAGEGVQTGR